MGRMSRIGVRTALVATGALGAFGCDDVPEDDFYGPLIYRDLPAYSAGTADDETKQTFTFQMSVGFAEGQPWEYLDLGDLNPVVPKVYVLTKGGQPIAGQYPIIDTLPGHGDYSPFWQVVEVSAPSDYEANQVKSFKTLDEADWSKTETSEAIYCPVINPDAAYVGADGVPIQVFWGTGEVVPNLFYDFTEATSPTLTDADATNRDIVLMPVWHKTLRGFCLDDEARRYPLEADPETGEMTLPFGSLNPQYVQFAPGDAEAMIEPAPYGNVSIFGTAPGSTGYHPGSLVQAVVTTDPTQAVTADNLDVASAQPIALAHTPLHREFVQPTEGGAE